VRFVGLDSVQLLKAVFWICFVNLDNNWEEGMGDYRMAANLHPVIYVTAAGDSPTT